MIKLAGSIVVLLSCLIIGNNLSKSSELTLNVTESLISFIAYIGTSIKTLRLPLNEIYSNFDNQTLKDVGFTSILKEKGLNFAIKEIEHIVSEDTLVMLNLAESNLGGIDAENQCELCKNIEDNLRIENLKLTHIKKKKMYQILPVLCGLSFIILII